VLVAALTRAKLLAADVGADQWCQFSLTQLEAAAFRPRMKRIHVAYFFLCASNEANNEAVSLFVGGWGSLGPARYACVERFLD